MPIQKIPIVHKFGIISHSQRLELQERILKQSYLDSVASRRTGTSKNPFEVTEDFIQEFNEAESIQEQEIYEDKARKLLERIKRKLGLKVAGHGNYVDLPLAWTELSQLSQCKGAIQEDCLDVMVTSLDQAPLQRSQIPALFFLAETSLYWLRTDAVNQPYLRTGELKLLRMGMLVFMRLFFHHMAGHLQGHSEFKTRLFTYLDGFAECQHAYSPFPNALLAIRFINEVGRMIIGESALEPGEMKEGDAYSPSNDQTQSSSNNKEQQSTVTKSESESEYFREGSADYNGGGRRLGGAGSQTSSSHGSGAISSSVHDLSPTLWHSLDVWRCIRRTLLGLQEALTALSNCAMGLASESWVDGIVALNILADAAKTDVTILRTLQDLAKGSQPKPPIHLQSENGDATTATGSMNTQDKSHSSKTSKSSHPTSSKFGLSDIYEKTEYDSSHSKSNARSGHTRSMRLREETEPDSYTPPVYDLQSPSKSTSKLHLSQSASSADKLAASPDKVNSSSPEKVTRSPCKTSGSPEKAAAHSPLKTPSSRSPEKLYRSPEKSSRVLISRDKTQETLQSETSQSRLQTGESGWQAELNTENMSAGRISQASSVPTYTNKWTIELPGLHGWHWEVAITYADVLADIVLHASSSSIVKVALLGNNGSSSTELDRASNVSRCPMPSAGLLDLIYFRAIDETNDKGSNDWSWRIRYAAIQGLVKICRCCTDDCTKEGMRTVAWNSLLRAHSLERDSRVLEALKVGQVGANIENLLSKHLAVCPSTIGAKIAAGLSTLYLPPIRAPVQVTLPRKKPAKVVQINKPVPRKPLRTSLREEIQLATALYEPPVSMETKGNYDLKRIVEDQWRKSLQVELDDAEDNREQNLEEQQLRAEETQRQQEESRKTKMKSRYISKTFDIPYTPTTMTGVSDGKATANSERSGRDRLPLRHGLSVK